MVAEVFDSVAVKEIIIGANNTVTANSALNLSNDGSGDASQKFSAGGTVVTMGVDNSLDLFSLMPTTATTGLSAASGLFMNGSSVFVIGSSTIPAGAKLAITSTTLGFLPPRMTTAQRDAIASPTSGLMVFNWTSGLVQFYTTSGVWMSLAPTV